MSAVLEKPAESISTDYAHPDFGSFRITFLEIPENDVQITIENTFCNLAAAWYRDGFIVREVQFVKRMSEGLMAPSWRIKVYFENENQPFDGLLKVAVNNEESSMLRVGLASEAVAAGILAQFPEFESFPKAIAYGLSTNDIDLFDLEFPENELHLSDPTIYIDNALPTSYLVQLYIRSRSLNDLTDINEFAQGVYAYAKSLDRVRDRTGMIHSDVKFANAIVPDEGGASQTKPIDWGGFWHAQAQPQVTQGSAGDSNFYPVGNEVRETVHAWQRRALILELFRALTGMEISSAAAVAPVYNEYSQRGGKLPPGSNYGQRNVSFQQILKFTAVAISMGDEAPPIMEDIEKDLLQFLYPHHISDIGRANEFIEYILSQFKSIEDKPSCAELVSKILLLYDPILGE